MKCLFLYNPNSGKGRIAKKLPMIRRRLSKEYETVEIVATKSGADMEEQARRGAEEYDAILFSGGDGTFNNVLQGVGEKDVQLGYLPAGTANDVARSLGIPNSLKGALRVITEGCSRKLDCMLVNGTRFCMYVTAAGAFTRVTYRTPQKRKKALGWFAYAVEGLRDMKLDAFSVRLECDGKALEAEAVLILVMNGRSVAGFPVNKDASMADGKLEAAIIRRKKHANVRQKIGAYFALAALFMRGVRVRRRDIEIVRGRSVRIETEGDVVWDFDGEEGLRGNVSIEILPKRVKLFVPHKKKI